MITITRSKEGGVFVVSVEMDGAENGDFMENARLFGEDAIELGGDILDESGSVVARVPSRRIKISQLPENPVRQRFAPAVFGDVARRAATAWYEQAKKRITEHISEKASKFDDFSAETTIHV